MQEVAASRFPSVGTREANQPDEANQPNDAYFNEVLLC